MENKENVKSDVKTTEPATPESPTKKLKTEPTDKSGTDDKNHPGNLKKRLEVIHSGIVPFVTSSLKGRFVAFCIFTVAFDRLG